MLEREALAPENVVAWDGAGVSEGALWLISGLEKALLLSPTLPSSTMLLAEGWLV